MSGVLWTLVIVGGLLAYWRYDIWRHPKVNCRPCNGRGNHSSALGPAFGHCWCCKGRGYHARAGSRFLAPAQYREVMAGKHSGRNY